MKRVIVIGGGASGMTAAIEAAKRGCFVSLIDANEKTGKKILATGNGKCNFTNKHMTLDCFRSESMDSVQQVLAQFGTADTLAMMQSLGIEPVERNGYYYPASGQAASVAEVFAMELAHQRVEVKTGEKADAISKRKGRFRVSTVDTQQKKHEYEADAVILSCGSKAGVPAAKAVDGYDLARSFGHSMTMLAPALTGLKCQAGWLKAWSGVRAEGSVSIYDGKKLLAKDTGELQLTDYGVSGIPVFQVSRFAALALQKKKQVTAVLDFFPTKSDEAVLKLLLDRKRRMDYKTYRELLVGLIPEKLIGVFLGQAGLREKDRQGDLGRLASCMKHLELCVQDVNPIAQAQVCAGGIKLCEINCNTMESRLEKGLYITGEMLDVDGICGGYNLQWAWATGKIAGKSAAL